MVAQAWADIEHGVEKGKGSRETEYQRAPEYICIALDSDRWHEVDEEEAASGPRLEDPECQRTNRSFMGTSSSGGIMQIAHN
ncbi:hypothetical protein CVT26_012384 [Gymnopilus dilepis]|uniref:Uncharacterized protein n=1 Tax=Gymnopilus dilepis TaxID=231916 RepID=A0A409WAN9_9AGAR|nr:hypothetical protein CVT26_012384 [Gymnopilus dilepis]